jgi:hypothetical protein
MASVFRPTTVADEERLVEFLTGVFRVGHGSSMVSSAMLRWKYWDARLDFEHPRSWVVEKEGRIVAHAGLWPVTVQTGDVTEHGVHMIDWASDPNTAGAGVAIVSRLVKTYDFILGIGGSTATRSIFPKIGFDVVGEAVTWARPLRPLSQMLQHQTKDLRLPVRFARNAWWAMSPSVSVDPEWTAVEWTGTEGLGATCERNETFFEYLKQCPVGRCIVFKILARGTAAGHFAMCTIRGQARVAGVWLADPTPQAWQTAFELVRRTALRQSNASELIGRGAGDAPAGMRVRAREPVFVLRKKKRAYPLPLRFQLCDNDALFYGEDGPQFLT